MSVSKCESLMVINPPLEGLPIARCEFDPRANAILNSARDGAMFAGRNKIGPSEILDAISRSWHIDSSLAVLLRKFDLISPRVHQVVMKYEKKGHGVRFPVVINPIAVDALRSADSLRHERSEQPIMPIHLLGGLTSPSVRGYHTLVLEELGTTQEAIHAEVRRELVRQEYDWYFRR